MATIQMRRELVEIACKRYLQWANEQIRMRRETKLNEYIEKKGLVRERAWLWGVVPYRTAARPVTRDEAIAKLKEKNGSLRSEWEWARTAYSKNMSKANKLLELARMPAEGDLITLSDDENWLVEYVTGAPPNELRWHDTYEETRAKMAEVILEDYR